MRGLRRLPKLIPQWRIISKVREKPEERAKRVARKWRRRVLIALVLSFVATLLLGAALGGGVSDPALQAGEPGAMGYVQGIPYADVFNGTAALGIDPRLVAAVASVESSFRPEVVDCRVVSDAIPPAKGIMQIRQPTASGLGVDPCVPEQAIPGGARYLLQLRDRFGAWDLAISAYNVGPDALAAAGRVVPNQRYVDDVHAKWSEYIAAFPSATLAAGGAPPNGPWGSTQPWADSTITPTTRRMMETVVSIFGRGPGGGCYRPPSPGDTGEHPKGRACDFYAGPVHTNQMPSPQGAAHGTALANFLVANAAQLNVRYVMWQGRIWQNGAWRHFEDRGNVTDNHYDHVHVSMNCTEEERRTKGVWSPC